MTMRTLMHSEVATVTEDDSIAVLTLRIVANSTRRVFRRQCKVRLWNVLCLSKGGQHKHEEK